MLRYLLFVVVVTASQAVYAQPINDIDAFQSQVDKCIKGRSPDSCLNKLLPQHFPPGNEEMIKTIPQVTSLLEKWLGNDTVYAVHPIKNTKVGNLVERRIYAIEGSQSGFMVLDTSYIRLRGNLYLMKFNLSSTDEKVNAMLNDKL